MKREEFRAIHKEEIKECKRIDKLVLAKWNPQAFQRVHKLKREDWRFANFLFGFKYATKNMDDAEKKLKIWIDELRKIEDMYFK